MDNRPLHLFFNRHIATNYLNENVSKTLVFDLDYKVIPCNSWDELSEKLQLKPKCICFHVDELEHTSAEKNLGSLLKTVLAQVGEKTGTVIYHSPMSMIMFLKNGYLIL